MPWSTFRRRLTHFLLPSPEPVHPGGPLFSVIIPVHRCPEKLDSSLGSVLGEQPKELFELIVIDGDSGDATLDLLRSHEGALRWVSEPDTGIYDAMNKGIRISSGKYLYFLGAGDRLRSGVLARVAQHLPEKKLGFVYGDVFMHDRNVIWDGPWTPEKFRKRTPCQQAIFYDRRVFSRHGLFEQRFKTMADYAMNIRCFGDNRIEKRYVHEIIADYEGGGYSANYRDEVFHAERPAMLLRHLGLRPKKSG